MPTQNMPTQQTRAHQPQGGFVIIEALIALLIFSMAVLGLVGLQASLSRATASAKYRAEAAYLASDLIGTMWVDAVNLANYKGTACASHALCNNWRDKVATVLPSAVTDISICLPTDPVSLACQDSLLFQSTNRVTITITWTVPGEGAHVFSTSTTITRNS